MTSLNSSQAHKYIGHIDGLRAVAVSLVVIFHAAPSYIIGGFIGVDVFFVISGYLITGIIYKDILSGNFDLTKFFSRRIRRIGPALFVVILSTLLLGWQILWHGDFRELGMQVVFASLFSANIYFWYNSGYFDAINDAKPLLHLWSLGVEEHFYFLWPLLLIWLSRKQKWLMPIIVMIILLSAILCISTSSLFPDANFFLLGGRLWELGIGGALALHHHRTTQRPQGLPAHAQATLGLVLVLGAAFGFDEGMPFPGWRALIPTVGTALMIHAGANAWINNLVLDSWPFRAIGLISYPMYLWHWPLLTLARSLGLHGQISRAGAVVLTVALAYLTYRYIETPIRSGRFSAPILAPRVTRLVLAGMALGAILGYAAPLAQRVVKGVPDWASVDYRDTSASAYRRGTCLIGPGQTGTAFSSLCTPERYPGSAIVVLWGDSHAAHLYPGLVALEQATGSGFQLAQLTASTCPPIFDIEMQFQKNCGSVVRHEEELLRRMAPDLVVMAGHWGWYLNDTARSGVSPERLGETVRRLRLLGTRVVAVVGPVPEWEIQLPQLLFEESRNGHPPTERKLAALERLQRIDLQMRQAAETAGALYVSPLSWLCPDGKACRTVVNTAAGPVPYAWDTAHLTIAASHELVRAIWAEIALATRPR